jgi:hypothetical protein
LREFERFRAGILETFAIHSNLLEYCEYQRYIPTLIICKRILDWSCCHVDAPTFLRFIFFMFLFPLNNFDIATPISYFLSYDFKMRDVVLRDIDRVRQVGSSLLEDHVTNLCTFWRYAMRLIVFTPGKAFDSLDEVVIRRWFAFVKDPTARCTGFCRHAFPLTVWLFVWQISLGFVSNVYHTSSDFAIAAAVLSGLFECLCVCENMAGTIIPQGLSRSVQGPLQREVAALWRGMADYLMYCAVAVQRCAQLTLAWRPGVVRRWPGMLLLGCGERGLLPDVQFFIGKVMASADIASGMMNGRMPDGEFVEVARAAVGRMEEALDGAAFRVGQSKRVRAEAIREVMSVDRDVAKGLLRESAASLVEVWRASHPEPSVDRYVEVNVVIRNVSFPVPVFRAVEAVPLGMEQIRRNFQ